MNKTPFVSKHDRQARDAVSAILADPRMDGIEFAEGVETWLADVLVRTIPKSDGAIEMADAYFGWRAEIDQANPRWRIVDVAQRADDIACEKALFDPEHRWFEAYQALQKGGPKHFSFGQRARLQPLVVELIDSLRHHNPAIEQQLQSDTVDRWIELGSVGLPPELVKSQGISWFFICVILLTFVQVARGVMAALAGG